MKTAQEMIESAFKPDGRGDKFDPSIVYWGTKTVKRLMKRYAKEAIKEHLTRAAENADFQNSNGYDVKDVILKTEIKLP